MIQKNPNIGLHQYEKKRHGIEQLPFAVYRSKIPQGFTYYPMHWHEEMEILYVEEGMLTLMVNGQKYTAEAGKFYVVSPGMIHAMEEIPGEHAVYYNVLFHLNFLMSKEDEDHLNESMLQPLLLGTKHFQVESFMSKEEKKEVLHTIKSLISYREQQEEEGIGFLVKSDLFRLLHGLRRTLLTSQEPMIAAGQMERMKKLTNWLLENVTEEITLASAAQFAGYSTSYFSKFFRNYTGTSYLHYFTMLKLEKSRKLLEATDLSAMEIGALCGFQNYSYFIRTFKKHYETTPKQYQMRSREKKRV